VAIRDDNHRRRPHLDRPNGGSTQLPPGAVTGAFVVASPIATAHRVWAGLWTGCRSVAAQSRTSGVRMFDPSPARLTVGRMPTRTHVGKVWARTISTSLWIVLDPPRSLRTGWYRAGDRPARGKKTPDHAVPTIGKERDRTKKNGPDRDRLKRKSIRPKMAVTVGFEPITDRISSVCATGCSLIFRGGRPFVDVPD